MDKRRKDEENTVAKLEEQLKVHKDSIKEGKSKMATVKTELGAVVANLNIARQREQMTRATPRRTCTTRTARRPRRAHRWRSRCQDLRPRMQRRGRQVQGHR